MSSACMAAIASSSSAAKAAAASAPGRELQQIVGDDIAGVFQIDYRRQNLLSARAPLVFVIERPARCRCRQGNGGWRRQADP